MGRINRGRAFLRMALIRTGDGNCGRVGDKSKRKGQSQSKKQISPLRRAMRLRDSGRDDAANGCRKICRDCEESTWVLKD
jgi:hypothetical protein